MANRNSAYERNMATYKEKWSAIYGDFKKTFDHMNGTCSNEKYWHMAPQDKVSLNIARHFNMEGYKLIESFTGA